MVQGGDEPHPHALLMSLIQPLRLGCEPLEDETNHGTFMINKETYFEPKVETTATPLEGLITLSEYDKEEMIHSPYLDPHIVMGDRSPLG